MGQNDLLCFLRIQYILMKNMGVTWTLHLKIENGNDDSSTIPRNLRNIFKNI